MRFGYVPFVVRSAADPSVPLTIYRPFVPIRVLGPAGSRTLYALLDTGADEMVLPGNLIDEIGAAVDPAATVQFRGVGGQLVTATYGTVTLEVAEADERYRWEATVAFLNGSNLTILGHAGFLQYFTATFDGEHRHVTLTPNAMLPSSSPA